MPAKINLIGQRFGKLTVLEETDKRKNKSVVWKCQCDCGNIVEYSTKQLRSDGIEMCPNCGNKRNPHTNLTESIIGKKFNHLTVLRETDGRIPGGSKIYECECDCENHTHVFVAKKYLISGDTKSCGCAKYKYKIGDVVNNRTIIGLVGHENNLTMFHYKCRCNFCGRIYNASSVTLDKTISCGCQKSIGEFNINRVLIENNIPFIKEYVFQNSNYRFDFALLDSDNNIIRLIEFDGEQHYEQNIKNSGWNTYQKYEQTYTNDIAKNNLAKEKGIPLVRIPYWERDNISLSLIMKDKYLVQ